MADQPLRVKDPLWYNVASLSLEKEDRSMLRSLIASSESGGLILGWIEWAALAIEVLAVLVIAGSIFYSLARYAVHTTFRPEIEDGYQQLKIRLGRSLLLGLEILVALCAPWPWTRRCRPSPCWACWC
jgi:hypothetical protein